jgi:hypothetical protein
MTNFRDGSCIDVRSEHARPKRAAVAQYVGRSTNMPSAYAWLRGWLCAAVNATCVQACRRSYRMDLSRPTYDCSGSCLRLCMNACSASARRHCTGAADARRSSRRPPSRPRPSQTLNRPSLCGPRRTQHLPWIRASCADPRVARHACLSAPRARNTDMAGLRACGQGGLKGVGLKEGRRRGKDAPRATPERQDCVMTGWV